MKKTFTINISGSIFHIDDDAFEKLQRYLHLLNKHFNAAVEGQEILQDIEARIAELFIERTNNKAEVITNEMVDEMIARMGKPEDFVEQEDEPAQKNAAETQPESEAKIRRRLYRDGESRVLGGVCSGLGAYFNIDPVILRIIFVLVLFMGGASIPVYLVLWIVVPKARTTAQKLEMRGKEATVTNIAQSIKEEVGEVKDNYEKFKNEKGSSRMDSFGDALGSGLRVVLRIAILIFGAVLIIAGIGSLIGFVTTLAVGHSFLHGGVFNFGWHSDADFPSVINTLVSPGAYTLSLIAIAILAGIPILMILFVGTKLLFRYQTNNKMIGLGALGLWLAALIVLIFVAVDQFGNFGKQSSQTITQKVECATCKTLYLELNEDLFEDLIDDDFSLNRMRIATVNGKEKLIGHPRFMIEKSSTGECLMLIKKRARGNNSELARKNTDEISYVFTQKDSTIHFDPYYMLKEESKWRDQELSLTLKIPEGKSVYLDPHMKDIIYDIENVENMWDGDMVGKTWTMTPDGLALKKAEPAPLKKK